ncbi:UNVERIFIED_CONTAM: endo-1,4-beta-xylanase [Acetivibrio alkalicellulosi]
MQLSKCIKGFGMFLLIFALLLSITLPSTQANAQTITITENEIGTHGGYDYEYWVDNGTGSMTLKDGGTFSCQWSNINNILFRKGRKFDETQTHQQIGNISVTYGVDYHPNGNSYLCVYGWTVDPLVEFYIVDSWGSWRPPGATSKGTINVDGGTYDIYETTRTQQPSIKGTATFQQYWSVRTSKRNSGTISVSQHFAAWENRGMRMGKMYEVALTIEGYQSSGRADVYSNTITIGGSAPVAPTNPPASTTPNSKSAFTRIEAEDYNSVSSSTIRTISIDSGSALGYIENGNTVTYNNIDFGSGATSFNARVASGLSTNTNIEVRLNSASGTLLGTLSVSSTGGWNNYRELSANISRVTGVHNVVLRFSGPVNIDWFRFGGSSTTNPTATPAPTNPPATPVPTNPPATPAPTNPPANNIGAYTVTYSQNAWGNGASVTVTIKNNSNTTVNGWTINWTYPGNQRITSGWNFTHTQSGSIVSARNAGHNGSIPPGGSVSFGFNKSFSGTNTLPTEFVVNGVTCRVQ